MNETNLVTTEKSSCEKYNLRWKEKSWWAIFLIDESIGLLSVQSDFGDYAYIWRSPGRPFKEFLTTIDNSYLIGKLGMGKHFDFEQTIKLAKQEVVKLRKSLDINEEKARACYDRLDLIKRLEYTDSQEAFCRLISESEEITDVFQDLSYFPMSVDYDPSLRAFVKDIWPEFVKGLKKEIASNI